MFAGELSAETAACIVGAICGFGGMLIGMFLSFRIIRTLDRIADETAEKMVQSTRKEMDECLKSIRSKR